MKLYDDHLIYDSSLQHRRVHQLNANGYNPEYVETRVVESESRDRAYLLGKLRVLDVPFEDADASEDTITAWVCSCDDFWFSQSDGIEDGEPPSSMGECKHVRQTVKVERARADEGQDTLGVTGDD